MMTNPYMYIAKSYLFRPDTWLKNIKWRLSNYISPCSYVFVVGAPRSGTTLLQRILTVHDDLFSIEGETGLFTKQNMFALQHFGLSRDENNSLFEKSGSFVEFFDKCVSSVSANGHHENKRFVEKTPQHVNYLSFILKRFPKSKVIHIVRDGRDCFCSARAVPNFPRNNDIAKFARYWRMCVRNGLQYDGSDRVFRVKYEDLAQDPEGEINKVMSFLGLSYIPQQIDPKFISNDHRSKTTKFLKLNEPINPSSIERWKKNLSRDELDTFITVSGYELELLGYI